MERERKANMTEDDSSMEDYVRELKDERRIFKPVEGQLVIPVEETEFSTDKSRRGTLLPNTKIQQSKFFLWSPKDLSELQQKILTLYQANIDWNDKELPDVYFTIEDLAHFLGRRKDALYTEAPKIVSELAKTTWELPIEVEGKMGYMAMAIFDGVGFFPGGLYLLPNQRLKESIHPRLVWDRAGKKVEGLDAPTFEVNQFTADKQIELEGKYTTNLYAILAGEVWKAKPLEISLERLRDLLYLGKKFPEYREFNRNVLTPAIKRINEQSDIFVKTDTKKEGKKIIGFIFNIYNKSTRAGIEKIKEQLVFYGISDGSLPYIFDTLKIEIEDVKVNIDYFEKAIKKHKDIRNQGAYLFACIVNNYARKSPKQIKEEEEKRQKQLKIQKETELTKEIMRLKNQYTQSRQEIAEKYIFDSDKNKLLQEVIDDCPVKWTVSFIKKTLKQVDDNVDKLLKIPSIKAIVRSYINTKKIPASESFIDYLAKHNITNVSQKFIDNLSI